jgi:glycosyltransferase involved in cell wall biosynthesis
MVLLIGNYPLDRYPSMQLFNDLMLHGLAEAGIAVELVRPEPLFGNIFPSGKIGKWLGYIDKFFLFPSQLRKKLADRPAVVHVCDHSSAMYVPACKAHAPVVVTCHDLFAVRAALGEKVDRVPTGTGRILQRRILRGLRRTDVLACVSSATAADAERIVRRGASRPQIKVVNLAPNFDYAPMPRDEARKRLGTVTEFDLNLPFVLHVGSNTPRKNRAGLLRIFARCRLEWTGQLVIAGEPLNNELRGIANDLGIASCIVEVPNPNGTTLEALYNLATAMLYPSRFEGFGWPIIEAQACGCPVICSNSAPLPEVAGDAGLYHDVDHEEAFARDLLKLLDPTERARWSEKSLRNAQRFSRQKMIEQYIEIYRGFGDVA